MDQAQQTALAVQAEDSSPIDQYLDLACQQSAIVRRAIDSYGEVSLSDYVRQILVGSESTVPVQPRNDLLETVYRYVSPLLGENIAERTASELERLPAVLTTNHHGVDFMAQSVQGSLIFSLREVGGKPATTVPVFACGNVPLDSHPTYPQGLLLYPGNQFSDEAPHKVQMRLPIFSNKRRREAVSTTGSYDATMLERARQRLETSVKSGQLTPELASAAVKIVEEDYGCAEAMELTSYSQQAVLVNNRIWGRCFREAQQPTDMVYLELEKITGMLLEGDLRNEDSLAWQVFFDPSLRDEVLRRLNGAKACWDQDALARNADPDLAGTEPSRGNCGTTFFWGINDAGRRVPLSLTSVPHCGAVLQGRDDRGRLWTIPFNPESVLQELRVGRLLPSLFTCFLTISFARGVSCCGGYFQAEYLPQMQQGLLSSLQQTTSLSRFADRLLQVPTDIYLSGMQAVMQNLERDLLVPAGPVEMTACGGMTAGDLQGVKNVTVRDAHLAALAETLPDIQRKEDLPVDWYLQLARENGRSLGDRVVVM